MIATLLPNHAKAIYREMRGEVERQIFEIDYQRWAKRLIEDTSILEMEETVIGARRHERGLGRLNQRNGFYQRSLDTVFGWIQDLRIPRPRRGGFTPTCLGAKHGRRQQALNKLAIECFWRGVSTRDVEKILEALCDVSISSSSVSRLAKQWDAEVKKWHKRRLSDDYVYLMFDGIWIKNRSLGATKRGTREVIDYMFARSESEGNWQKFLNQLVHRGLTGKTLRLITTDGCGGLANAIDMVFPTVPHQLCWAHKMRNILNKVRTENHEAVRTGLTPLFEGEWTETKATTLINAWSRRWRGAYPNAVRCLEKDLDRLLLYLDHDPEHHKAIRTSNHIERQFKEYRRRMRPMEIIPNQPSADRILYSLTMIRNEKLARRPLAFTQKMLH